jgi:hypothetical protein
MVDKDQILKVLQARYEYDPSKAWIDDDGLVYVDGYVSAKRRLKTLGVNFGKVKGFDAQGIGLTSLVGSPTYVTYMFDVRDNKLENLLGAPESVGKLLVDGNPLKSLEGCPSEIRGRIYLTYSTRLPMLRTLVAQEVSLPWNRPVGGDEVEKILNDARWMGKGKLGAIPCAAELIRAGYASNAKW